VANWIRDASAGALALSFVMCLGTPVLASETGTRAPRGTIAVNGGGTGKKIYLISPATRMTRPVTAPDDVFDFDLSPDGRRIAVAGFTGIWIMGRDGSGSKRIFDGRRLASEAVEIAWSPDSSRLAYIRGETLFTISADGTDVKRVAGHAAAPDWTPDGLKILFVRNPETSSRRGAIYEIRADGGGLRRIIRGAWYGPAVSPDGAKILLYKTGLPGVFIVPAKGGKPRLLIRDGSQPQWSPNGRYVGFTRDVKCWEVCTSRIFVRLVSTGAASAYGPKLGDMGPFSWAR
jgi:Tol biopolymer transport system component